MKTVLTLFSACCFVLSSFGAAAQSEMTELEMIQSIVGTEKKAALAGFIDLPESQSADFWSLYDAYEMERKDLGKTRVNLLKQYAKSHSALTDDQADNLMKEAFKLNSNIDALLKKYYGKMKKVSSAKTAVQFYQLESYVNTAIRMAIYQNVPFVGEM